MVCLVWPVYVIVVLKNNCDIHVFVPIRVCIGVTLGCRLYQIRVGVTFGHRICPSIASMLRIISVFSFSVSAVSAASSSVGSADQTLPAINVKFDFPSSSALVSAKDRLDIGSRYLMFAKRMQHILMKTQQLSTVLEDFAKEAHDQLDAVLSVVQTAARNIESHKAQTIFSKWRSTRSAPLMSV